MEQLTWDYKGYENYPPLLQTSLEETIQTDWNNTIITKINHMSAMIYQKTHMGGANKIKINSVLLPLFKDLEYFKIDDNNEMSLGGRYHITIDDSLPKNIVFLSHETKDILYAKENNSVFCSRNIKKEDSDYYEINFTLLLIDSDEYNQALSDPNCTVLTDENLSGKIEILNYE